MEITVKIPQSIINLCSQCGWDEQQTKDVITHFIEEVVMNNDYGSLYDDFDIWINDEEFEEIFPGLIK
jgi:hypothetical protein